MKSKNAMKIIAAIITTIVLLAVIGVSINYFIFNPNKTSNISASLSVTPPISGSDWTGFLGDAQNTNYNNMEKNLSPASISANLALEEVINVTQGVQYQDAIANQVLAVHGILYFGNWNGDFYAVNEVTKKVVWRQFMGGAIQPPCWPFSTGVSSNPTYDNNTIYVGGGNGYFYALNATTGAVIWKTFIAIVPNEFLWGSPVIGNGHVYIGVSSYGDCPLIRGKLDMLNQTTGALQATHYTASTSEIGNSIWSKPLLIPSLGLVVYNTGNGSSDSPENSAIVALNWNTLQPVWIWQPPLSALEGGDFDFGASPLAIENGYNNLPVIIGHDKNGFLYAITVNISSAKLLWSLKISDGGSGPEHGNGDIASGMYDGQYVYYASSKLDVNGKDYSSAIYKIAPATGKIIWRTLIQNSFPLGAITGANGFLVTGNSQTTAQGYSGYFTILNTQNGAILYTEQISSGILGSPSIADGQIIIPALDGNIYILGLAQPANQSSAVTNGKINPVWNISGSQTGVQLSQQGITVPNSTTSANLTSQNYLNRINVSGNFSLSAQIQLNSANAGEQGDIILSQDPSDYLTFGLYCYASGKGHYVITVHQFNKPEQIITYPLTIDLDDPAYFNLVEIGTTIYGYASLDGKKWDLAGTLTLPFLPSYIGVGAYHTDNTPTSGTTTFDTIILRQL